MEIRTNEISKLATLAGKLSTLSEKTRASSFRVYHAEEIFNKFVLHLISFQHNLPESTQDRFPDLSVLASIARMVIEAHNAVHYFADKSLSEEQIKFRVWLYVLHYCSEFLRVLDKFTFEKSESIYWNFETSKNISISELKRNSYFNSFTKKEQAMLLRAQKAFYWRGSRPKNSPFPGEYEEAIYKLLSNYVHSFPLGNTMYKGGGSANPLSFENFVFLVIEAVVCYSASVISMYSALRWKLARRLSKEEKSYLKALPTSRSIEKWISFKKTERLYKL